jgi:hypothetical protein
MNMLGVADIAESIPVVQQISEGFNGAAALSTITFITIFRGVNAVESATSIKKGRGK